MQNKQNPFLENIIQNATRYMMLLLYFNYLVLFLVFAILLYDILFIARFYIPNFYHYIPITLLTITLIIAYIQTKRKIPPTPYILSMIDHKTNSRGSLSLLNELYQKDPTNPLIAHLLDKNQQLSQKIGMRKIFPFKSLYHHFLAATICFSLLVWLALPSYDKNITRTYTNPQLTSTTDFALQENSQILNDFLNKEQTPPQKTNNTNPENLDNSNPQRVKENIIDINQSQQINQTSIQEQKPEDNQKKLAEKKQEEVSSEKNKHSTSNGTSSEENQTSETTEIKNINPENLVNAEIQLSQNAQQDGSSTRSAQQKNDTAEKMQAQTSLQGTIKGNPKTNIQEYVAPKYHKIIERYFSDAK